MADNQTSDTQITEINQQQIVREELDCLGRPVGTFEAYQAPVSRPPRRRKTMRLVFWAGCLIALLLLPTVVYPAFANMFANDHAIERNTACVSGAAPGPVRKCDGKWAVPAS